MLFLMTTGSYPWESAQHGDANYDAMLAGQHRTAASWQLLHPDFVRVCPYIGLGCGKQSHTSQALEKVFGGYIKSGGLLDSNAKIASCLPELLMIPDWLDVLSDSPIHCHDDSEEDSESPLTAMKSIKQKGLLGL
jgi:hypothetical protein